MRQAILEASPHRPAILVSETAFGRKYEAVISLTGANGCTTDVITIRQFDRLPDGVQYADAPRLVTLYIP